MPTKAQLTTIALTLVALAVINKVEALKPIKKMVMDEGWL